MSEAPSVANADAMLAVLRERYRSSIGATLASLDRLGGQTSAYTPAGLRLKLSGVGEREVAGACGRDDRPPE